MVAGVHIRIESKGNARGAGKASGHNSREVITKSMEKYLLNEEDRGDNLHHPYELTIGQVQAEIKANNANGHKLHHRAKPFKELLFTFEERHTDEDLLRVIEKLTDRFGIRPIRLDGHRDEGSYKDLERTQLDKRNLHAHLVYTTNNPDNNRQIHMGGKKGMRDMQKIVSDELGIKLGIGLYEPGGRLDPRKKLAEREPHRTHWAERSKKEREAKAAKKLQDVDFTLNNVIGSISEMEKRVEDSNAQVRDMKMKLLRKPKPAPIGTAMKLRNAEDLIEILKAESLELKAARSETHTALKESGNAGQIDYQKNKKKFDDLEAENKRLLEQAERQRKESERLRAELEANAMQEIRIEKQEQELLDLHYEIGRLKREKELQPEQEPAPRPTKPQKGWALNNHNQTIKKTMKTYNEFCTRYELDPASKQAGIDYVEYQNQLKLFNDLPEPKPTPAPRPTRPKKRGR